MNRLSEREEMFYRKLYRALLRQGVTELDQQCLALAMAQHESTRKPGELTLLAEAYNNPWGYKWIERRDVGRYAWVKFPPNEWERAHGIGGQRYRAFDCLCAAVFSWHDQIFKSSSYASCRTALPDWRRFIDAVYEKWSEQEDDGKLVHARWEAWKERLAEGWNGRVVSQVA